MLCMLAHTDPNWYSPPSRYSDSGQFTQVKAVHALAYHTVDPPIYSGAYRLGSSG